MGGDSIVWLVIILSILICEGLAVYLYRKKRFPLWVSAIIIALLVPVIVYSFVALGIDYLEKLIPIRIIQEKESLLQEDLLR